MLTTTAACDGFLAIFPRTETACTQNNDCNSGELCIDGTCQFGNGGLCWIYNEQGNCPPTGSSCVDGVCAKTATSWCDCDPATTICRDGGCLEPSEDSSCSAFLPNGGCIAGSVCVAGTCVVINRGNICTINRLGGLCPSGAGCEGGVCVPISDDPCGPGNLDGLCPSGATCGPDGTCQYVPCSASAPTGACPEVGQYCDEGVCRDLPCSTDNVNGECENAGEFCSTTGTCIPNGTCNTSGDCNEGNFCAGNSTCIPNGTCLTGADCDEYSLCTNGSCVRDTTCTDDSRCASGEHCLGEPNGQCGPSYACIDNTDCQTGYFCSISLGECIPQDECFNDADCAIPGHCNVPSNQCVCSRINECIARGSCAADADCGYGQRCSTDTQQCVPLQPCVTNTDCTDSNGTVRDDQLCSKSNRASGDAGLCVTVGRCRFDGDCNNSYAGGADNGLRCDTATNTCSKNPANLPPPAPQWPVSCGTDADCGSGRFCTYYGVCANGDNGTGPTDGGDGKDCGSAADCTAPRACINTFKCNVSAACGGDRFEATLVQPNMLILLDRSGSMNESVSGPYANVGTAACPDQSVKRWNIAVDAINQVLAARGNVIRFGLSTYPSRDRCGGSQDCSVNCNNSCKNGCPVSSPPAGSNTNDNCEPGFVDVAVNSPTSNITASLAGNDPGGRTPTSRALEAIANNPSFYGLPVANDTQVRDNYVLFITDGDPNCGGAVTCPASCKDSAGKCRGENCIVNYELDRLLKLPTPIKTFTVGFAFSTVKSNLNCNAVYGGTSLCRPSVTTSNCSSSPNACYYQASNSQALVDALGEITKSVSGCTFVLDRRPPDENALYVFTQERGQSGYKTVAKEGSADTSDGYYTYDANQLRLQLNGPVCDRVRDGSETPVIIYGCATPAG